MHPLWYTAGEGDKCGKGRSICAIVGDTLMDEVFFPYVFKLMFIFIVLVWAALALSSLLMQ